MPPAGGSAVRITTQILQRFYCRAPSAFPSVDTIAYKWLRRGGTRGPKLPVAGGSTADGSAHGVSSQILPCASPECTPLRCAARRLHVQEMSCCTRSSMLLSVIGSRCHPLAQVSNHKLFVTIDTLGER